MLLCQFIDIFRSDIEQICHLIDESTRTTSACPIHSDLYAIVEEQYLRILTA